jgi:phage terminase large subunit
LLQARAATELTTKYRPGPAYAESLYDLRWLERHTWGERDKYVQGTDSPGSATREAAALSYVQYDTPRQAPPSVRERTVDYVNDTNDDNVSTQYDLSLPLTFPMPHLPASLPLPTPTTPPTHHPPPGYGGASSFAASPSLEPPHPHRGYTQNEIPGRGGLGQMKFEDIPRDEEGKIPGFYVRTGEICYVGPAGTGKTRAILEWFHRRCLDRPGIRVLIAREYREDHTQSTMKTLQNEVFPAGTFGDALSGLPIVWHGGEQAYLYENGSTMVIKGLRDSRGIYSQQYDHIFVNEAGSIDEDDYDQLLRAKRNRMDELSLLIPDLNPEYEMHWLHQRCDEGVTHEVITKHSDNPSNSEAYLRDLASMRDVNARTRLFLGQRVSSLPNAYYQDQLADLRNRGHICPIEPQKGVLVHTGWDLGRSDYTAIWFCQRVRGEWHLVEYYESNLEEIDHYMFILQQFQSEYRWIYGTHALPHDAQHKTLASRGLSVQDQLWDLGMVGDMIIPPTPIQVQHNRVRQVLPQCYFDNSRWEQPEPGQRWRRGVRYGVQRLAAYRAAKDKALNVMRPRPEHDEASHGASAFAQLVLSDPTDLGSRPAQAEARQVDWLRNTSYDSGQGSYRRATHEA